MFPRAVGAGVSPTRREFAANRLILKAKVRLLDLGSGGWKKFKCYSVLF